MSADTSIKSDGSPAKDLDTDSGGSSTGNDPQGLLHLAVSIEDYSKYLSENGESNPADTFDEWQTKVKAEREEAIRNYMKEQEMETIRRQMNRELLNAKEASESSESISTVHDRLIARKAKASALEAQRQIGAVTYVESCAFNPVTAREAFEVCVLAASGKLHNGQSLLSAKHLGSLSSSLTLSSSSPSSTDSSCTSTKLKSSASTHLLTRHKSLFKLRKCKSKSELKLDSKKSCSIM